MAEGHHGGFWTSLPGVLTGVAALITALTGAAILLREDDQDPAPAPAPMPSVNNQMAGTGEADGNPAVPDTAPVPSAAVGDPVAEQVKATAAVLNAMMPRQLDAITTQTGVTAEGRTLTFHHAVEQRIADDEIVRQFVRAIVCNNPEMLEDIEQLGVTYRMSYQYPDSKVPLDVDVTAGTCSGATL